MLIGIDVAKSELVVAARPSGERWTVANDERGVRALVERLGVAAPELIVLEATGGYELLCVAALVAVAARGRSKSAASARFRKGDGTAGEDRSH